MLRTMYKNKEIIIRIKRNLFLHSLSEDEIYQSLLSVIDTIYNMGTFAVIVKNEFWIIGDIQLSALPLITVQNIIPVKNVIRQ